MGHVLMSKFSEFEKTGLFGLLFQNIRFWQFQDKTREGNKLEALKIHGILRHGKGLTSIKKPRWKKSKPEPEVAKIGLFSFG
jgi:hypothetical protein